MAISETVYSPTYPNNTKTVTVDIQSRIPIGAEGDEKYVLYVYTSAYSNNTSRTTISPVVLYNIKRGWAQSFVVSSPVTSDGGTLTVAIDEAAAGVVTLTVASGTYNASAIAADLQTQLRNTASGTGAKVDATNRLSYLNAQVYIEDGRFTFLSGSTKSYYSGSDYTDVSSVLVPGGTLASALGFSTGYPNSNSISTTSSGWMHAPASAHATVDDAVKFAIMTLVNQIDFSS